MTVLRADKMLEARMDGDKMSGSDMTPWNYFLSFLREITESILEKVMKFCILSGAFLIPAITWIHAADPAPIDFVHTVLPIVKKACWECHSKEKKIKGNLAFDPEDLKDQIGEFNAIQPGKPDSSSVIERMRLDETSSDFMPKNGRPMKPEDLELIVKWIEQGAIVDAKNLTKEEKEYLRASKGESNPEKAAPTQEFLKWTDRQGRVIEARFVGLENDAVKIVMRNGNSYVVPLTMLDDSSAQQARNLAK